MKGESTTIYKSNYTTGDMNNQEKKKVLSVARESLCTEQDFLLYFQDLWLLMLASVNDVEYDKHAQLMLV